MTICKMRVKPFDVMIIKNCEHDVSRFCHPFGWRMTSQMKERVTHNWPRNQQQKKNRHTEKQSAKRSFKLLLSVLNFQNYQQPSILNIIKFSCYCWYCDIKWNWISKANMLFTRKKKQSSRMLLSQLDDFDQDMIIGNAASERQENVVVNKGTNDQDFTISTSSNNTAVNESTVNVRTLERCFNERIDREMNHIIDTVEDRIQNAILTAIDNIVAPKIELAIRSVNVSSGRDVTSVVTNSERGEHVGIIASFKNASGNNNTLGVSNVNDETRHIIPDEVSGLTVPETHSDRQIHTHHTNLSNTLHVCSLQWTNDSDCNTHSLLVMRKIMKREIFRLLNWRCFFRKIVFDGK